LLLCLGLVFALGAFLRLYDLGSQSLWIDEGYSINAAAAVKDKGIPLLESGEWYLKGVLDVYSIALSSSLLGFDPNNPWSARLPAAILGSLSILAVYIFSKKLFKSDAVSLASSIFMALWTWEIAWSRQARGYAGMQLFLMCAFYCFYCFYETGKRKYLAKGFAVFAVAALFHPAAFVMIVPLMLFLAIDAVRKGNYRDPKIISLYSGMVAICVILFALLAPKPFDFGFTHVLALYLMNTYPILVLSAAGALVWVIWSKRERIEIIFLSSFIVIPLIVLSVYWHSVETRYLLSAFPLLLVLSSVFFFKAIRVLARSIKIKDVLLVSSASVVIAAGAQYTYLTIYPPSEYSLGAGAPQPDFEGAYNHIKTLLKERDIVVSPYSHLSKIYLGDRGYWLMISLLRREDEITAHLARGKDYYTGAPMIADAAGLKEIMSKKSGFLVLDALAWKRLSSDKTGIIAKYGKIVYVSGETSKKIIVYEF
jgi:4-amino-4-deoxy-L-arabinose transferase-like glycosyltransferase